MNLLAQGLAFSCVEAWLTNVASHASNMCHLIGTWFDDSDISQHEVGASKHGPCHVAHHLRVRENPYPWTLQTFKHARVRRRRNEDP